jgi:hypothetical protein
MAPIFAGYTVQRWKLIKWKEKFQYFIFVGKTKTFARGENLQLKKDIIRSNNDSIASHGIVIIVQPSQFSSLGAVNKY